MGKTKTPQKPWQMRQARGRRFGRLSLRKRFLIVTNGETEAAYFENYRGSTGPKVKIVRRLKDPCLLVKKAVAERARCLKRGEAFHETWIVMDRDKDTGNKNHQEQFNQALRDAKDNNIEVAFSDDAFEIWYLLHYQDVTSPLTRQELIKVLEKHRGQKYEKGEKGDLYHEILHLRQQAIKRAHALIVEAEGQLETINPSTRVHILVERLLGNDPRLT